VAKEILSKSLPLPPQSRPSPGSHLAKGPACSARIGIAKMLTIRGTSAKVLITRAR